MRAWIACVVLLGACKKHDAKPKEPPPDPQNPSRAELPWFEDLPDPPLAISAVTVKPTPLHSYDQALTVRFTVTGKRAITDGQVLKVKASCRVGLSVAASAVPVAIELRDLAAGAPQQVEAIPFGSYGFTGDVRTCELGWYLDPPSDAKPARIKTACWSAGSITSGRCTDLVPRVGVAPFKLGALSAQLVGDHVAVDVTITAGPGRTRDEVAHLRSSCAVDGKVVDADFASDADLAFLSSGEEFRTTASLPASPRCEVRLVVGATELTTFCLRDGKLTEGGC